MYDLFVSERSTVELRAVSGRLRAASGRLRPDGSGRLLVGPLTCDGLPLFAICATLVRILLSLVVARLPYCYTGSDAINFIIVTSDRRSDAIIIEVKKYGQLVKHDGQLVTQVYGVTS